MTTDELEKISFPIGIIKKITPYLLAKCDFKEA